MIDHIPDCNFMTSKGDNSTPKKVQWNIITHLTSQVQTVGGGWFSNHVQSWTVVGPDLESSPPDTQSCHFSWHYIICQQEMRFQ